jgi:hypothetical protein
MKKFIQAFRDLEQSKRMGIDKARIVYLKNTGWQCFWFFNDTTLMRLKEAEIIC